MSTVARGRSNKVGPARVTRPAGVGRCDHGPVGAGLLVSRGSLGQVLVLEGPLDLVTIEQDAQAVSAVGEAISDFLDLGFDLG